jgi:nitrite reductase/ring-hydroxylating ferredoxin subunit
MEQESGFHVVGQVADFPPGGTMVEVGGRQVALFRMDDGWYALDNRCLHHGGPVCEGRIDNGVVTCPWHGWSYEIKTGTLVQDPRVGLSRHDVRLDGGEVSIRLNTD